MCVYVCVCVCVCVQRSLIWRLLSCGCVVFDLFVLVATRDNLRCLRQFSQSQLSQKGRFCLCLLLFGVVVCAMSREAKKRMLARAAQFLEEQEAGVGVDEDAKEESPGSKECWELFLSLKQQCTPPAQNDDTAEVKSRAESDVSVAENACTRAYPLSSLLHAHVRLHCNAVASLGARHKAFKPGHKRQGRQRWRGEAGGQPKQIQVENQP